MDNNPAGSVRRVADTALIALFIMALFIPVADMLIHFDRTPNAEMRKLSPTPTLALDLASLRRFPSQIKDWTNDHFGLRNFMIRQHGLMKVRLLGVSSTPQVIIGKQDSAEPDRLAGTWLFYAAYNTMNYNLHRKPFTPEQLETWTRVMNRRQAWLAERGARYVFVIAPNGQTIYPEFLPDKLQNVTTRTRADQLIEHLRATTTIEVIDLRQALFDARRAQPDERLFQRTDTHWNDLGSLYAYTYLADHLRKTYSHIQPLQRDQFDLARSTTPGGDLAGLLGGRDFYKEKHLNLVPREPFKLRVDREQRTQGVVNASADDPDHVRLLMFRDSFGEAFVSYLAEHFEHSRFVWTDRFDQRHIDELKPTLVITQMVERLLWRDISESEWMTPALK